MIKNTEPKSSRIVVLGGAGGIGRALVDHLVAAGNDVVVLDLATSLERHPPVVTSMSIDILSERATEKAFADLLAQGGKIDGFVNLAGYNSHLIPLRETAADYFDDIIAGNLRGAFIATKFCLPLMNEGSSMVMVSSGLASNVRPGYGAYSASKAAVIAMTKTFALENAPSVRVNAVAPGLVDTAFLRGGTGRSAENAQSIVSLDAYRAATPMKRLAEPKDIVGPIAFLLSDASAFMTGQVLWVNGGGFMP